MNKRPQSEWQREWRHNQQIYQINHELVIYTCGSLHFSNFSHFHIFSLSLSSMAETSTLFRFRFSSPPFNNSIISRSSKPPFSFNNNNNSFHVSPSSSHPRLLRFSPKATHSSSNNDFFEFFPWSDDDNGSLFNFIFQLISFCLFIFLDFVYHTLNSKIRDL